MQTISTLRQPTIGQDKKPIGDNPSKMDMFGPSQGAATSLISPNNPILSGLPLTNVPKAVNRVWGRFNIPRGRFGALMRGIKGIYHGTFPPLHL
jgi:hypothetical protein